MAVLSLISWSKIVPLTLTWEEGNKSTVGGSKPCREAWPVPSNCHNGRHKALAIQAKMTWLWQGTCVRPAPPKGLAFICKPRAETASLAEGGLLIFPLPISGRPRPTSSPGVDASPKKTRLREDHSHGF